MIPYFLRNDSLTALHLRAKAVIAIVVSGLLFGSDAQSATVHLLQKDQSSEALSHFGGIFLFEARPLGQTFTPSVDGFLRRVDLSFEVRFGATEDLSASIISRNSGDFGQLLGATSISADALKPRDLQPGTSAVSLAEFSFGGKPIRQQAGGLYELRLTTLQPDNFQYTWRFGTDYEGGDAVVPPGISTGGRDFNFATFVHRIPTQAGRDELVVTPIPAPFLLLAAGIVLLGGLKLRSRRTD